MKVDDRVLDAITDAILQRMPSSNEMNTIIHDAIYRAWLSAFGADGCQYPFTAQEMQKTIKEAVFQATLEKDN